MKSPVTININNLKSSKLISSDSSGNESNSFINTKLLRIVFHAHINNFCSLNKKFSVKSFLFVNGCVYNSFRWFFI